MTKKKTTLTQKRTIALACSDLRVREAGDGSSRVVEGYALKFGVRSRMLCDWWENYYEVLEPGSLDMATLKRQDIKLTLFHDRQLVLARSNKGKGTLEYGVDEVGVWFRADMPHTSDGDKALELVARGDIAGCSFIYSTSEDDPTAVSYERLPEKDEQGEDVLLRHVHRIERVYDFTLTTDPAYEQTNVTRREVENFSEEIFKDREEEKLEELEDEKPAEEEPEKGEPTEENPVDESEEEPEKEEDNDKDDVPVDRSKAREWVRLIRERISRSI